MKESDIIALHKKYAPSEEDFNLVYEHCSVVAEIALWCAGNTHEPVDRELLRTAALLHDIGSHPFLAAWSVNESYSRIYPQHAMMGAKLLAEEGLDPNICSIIETHPLLGVSKEEIIENKTAMPARDFIPQTIEGRLLCYADRFHSKKPIFSKYDTYLENLKQKFPKQAVKFEAWAKEFGIPDIELLAKKYGHPIR
ncbi:HD domain-containing protein [Candidatus Saccharibacteria bacterium]|nr:HD domain-containing protein [Candidatus Saccharibacteria bacterium]